MHYLATALSVVWMNVLIFLLALSSKQTEQFAIKSYELVSPPPLIELKAEVVKLLTFGHLGLYHDFINIWALQFLVDPGLKQEEPEQVFKVVKRIASHRPKLESFYMISCFVLALDLKRPEYCEPIIIEGLHAFPNSWRIPMTQGFIFGFELKDRAKASAFYHLAASREKSPPYVARLAKKLLSEEALDASDIEEAIELIKTVPGGEKIERSLKLR